jgi:sugar lactone lactonase YvrE
VLAELVLDARAQLGEGPVWDGARLLWVDIPAGLVHAFDPVGGADEAVSLGEAVGFVVLLADGGPVAVTASGIREADGRGGLLRPVECGPGERPNDGKADPAGRVWAGFMVDGAAPGQARLVRFERDRPPAVVLDGLTIPNGIDWSPDGSTMYYADSPTGRVDAFDFDVASGALSERRPLARVDEGLFPDGLTVDAEGGVWVAVWGGSAVYHYGPDGRLEGVVEVPVAQVTSCAFGGADLDVLYITTAAATDQPGAGGVFACSPGVRGRPPSRAVL